MPEIHEFESDEELVLANRLRDMKDHRIGLFKNVLAITSYFTRYAY